MEITIEHVYKAYGPLIVYHDLNMFLPSDQMICLYGESGCGKTTLLNMIGLIESYDKGTIKYNGQTIRSYASKKNMLRHHIGFIFQDFGLIENATILENMDMVPIIRKRKDKKQAIKAALDQVHLNYDLNRPIYSLSGGEQQRVAIAKMIVKDPDLILADEPTASLDHDNKVLILDLLKQFTNQHKTVIVVSHDDQVKTYCDQTIALHKYQHQN